MVPATFHVLDAYPLTANGKVDDRALSALGIAPAGSGSHTMPSSDTERKVAAIWCELLGIERVGLHDNFFDLGGHSLLVPRLHRRLHDQFDTTLTMVELFRYTSIAAISSRLTGLESDGGSLDDGEKRAQLRRARRARVRGAVPS
jgi:acyl carrier protein